MTNNINSSIENVELADQTSNENPAWIQLGLHCYIKIAIVAVCFYFLFHNVIDRIVGEWLNDPSWSHGFLIPLFSLYFINQRKNQIINSALNNEFKPNYIGLVFLIFGIVFYPFNIVKLQYGYFSPLDMIATMGTIILFLGGWKLVKYTWLPTAFLIFAIPLPARYYVAVTMPMRKLATAVTTVLLNMISGIEADASGVIIDVIYKGQRLEPPLNVAEACSGMRLLMAFLALGVAMAYLHYRPFWQRLVLLANTISIAIFCNIVRVTVTGFIYIFGNPRYARGIYHDMLGMLMLPLAFGLYGFLAWFMSSLFIEDGDMNTEDIIVRKRDT